MEALDMIYQTKVFHSQAQTKNLLRQYVIDKEDTQLIRDSDHNYNWSFELVNQEKHKSMG